MTPGRLVRRLLRAELYSIIRLYQPISARLHTRHEGASFADLHDDVQLVVFLVLEGFKQLYNVRVTEVLLDLNLLSELCDPYVIHPIKTHLPQEASKGCEARLSDEASKGCEAHRLHGELLVGVLLRHQHDAPAPPATELPAARRVVRHVHTVSSLMVRSQVGNQ